ncbi:hypothetical protein TNCV_2675081 [Trichonephila clavipes]|nr:hypothetical protein TNCV_2675081 [Trichonephila clavipes]
MMRTTPDLAPLQTTAPHQREDHELDEFNVHQPPLHLGVFSGTRTRTHDKEFVTIITSLDLQSVLVCSGVKVNVKSDHSPTGKVLDERLGKRREIRCLLTS